MITGSQTAKAKAEFRFLQLPPELRKFIYKYALYDENIGHRCPTILLINRQIYSEASEVQYAQTHTLRISPRYIEFCNRRYRFGIERGLPRSFPYHKLNALCVRVLRRMTRRIVVLPSDIHMIFGDNHYYSPFYEQRMGQLNEFMRTIADKGFPLKKLILDVWSPSPSLEPMTPKDYSAILVGERAFFDKLRFNNKGTTRTIEIVLGTWAKECPEVVEVAHNWGRAALCHGSGEEGSEEGNEGPIIRFEEADAEQ
ncbi:MAG: hypothetical protein HETSPECPRED_002137 [Heterodermia speciosa]|uniref:Uncharacterized protein n=1 Tax=Heterodermia speciosa TaxID=116794 RepID=A0A8H3J3G4_9LECA|nr:MAG: hypothetical protein HETSPECPRED_002137 [Heterodermia speciosa]